MGAFKDIKNKEQWMVNKRYKQRQYKQFTDLLKDKVTLNIIQFDIAGRMGPETAKILDKVGIKRHITTNIQLMILSLNSWLYRNAISKAATARCNGRGMESMLWAEKLLAGY